MSRYGRMRSGVKQWRSSLCKCIYISIYRAGRAGTGPCGRERPPGIPRNCSPSYIHRRTLDRVNAINDSLK